MQIQFFKDKIEINKETDKLDLLVTDFSNILNKLNIRYAIISGYVSILFGRNRLSEDIDIFVEKIEYSSFKHLWKELMVKFECVNTQNPKEAYNSYLLNNTAIRFSIKKEFVPNIEMKFPKNELDFWSLENRKKVILNKTTIFISPLELQIPFKFILGSEKDIEDAYYLYNLLSHRLDLNLLKTFIKKLNIEEIFNKYIK